MWVGKGLLLQAFQDLAGLLGLAGLAQLAGVQQRHARVDREALDDLADDAFGQRRLVQRLGQAAEGQPHVEVVGQRLVVQQLAQQLGRTGRLAAATAQRNQRVTPGLRIGVAQQRFQFAPGHALAPLTQRQGRLGGPHGQRFGGALLP